MQHAGRFEALTSLEFLDEDNIAVALGSALAARLSCPCIIASVPAGEIYNASSLPSYQISS